MFRFKYCPRLQKVVFLLGCLILVTPAAICQEAVDPPAADNAVSQRVQKQLQLHAEQRRPLENVSAQAQQGVVTLSGQVDSLASKWEAARIAKHVRGVRSVVNQILVDDHEVDSETIAACARRALHEDLVAEKAEIAVSVDRGKVALLGSVGSLAEKRFAERAVADVAGVTSIRNQLTVDLNRHNKPGELQTEIDALIKESLHLQDSQLTVTVEGSRVSVQGAVAKADHKDLLEELVSVAGVSEVSVDAVQVDPSLENARLREDAAADFSDDAIQSAVRRAIRANPLLLSHAAAIQVAVQGGRVTLTGLVDRLSVKQAAEQTAENTVGVRSVANHLEVQWSADTPSDQQIIAQTQAALQRSAYLDRRDIRVHCQRAHVHLYGLVESEFEKRQATRIANNVRGVVHVANMLAVAPQWEAKPDQEILNQLQETLKRYTLSEVDVTVRDGVALLSGEVDTWQQWQAALDAAVEAGARKPHSTIRVRYHPAHTDRQLFVP